MKPSDERILFEDKVTDRRLGALYEIA